MFADGEINITFVRMKYSEVGGSEGTSTCNYDRHKTWGCVVNALDGL
jgi:hypothetical protein